LFFEVHNLLLRLSGFYQQKKKTLFFLWFLNYSKYYLFFFMNNLMRKLFLFFENTSIFFLFNISWNWLYSCWEFHVRFYNLLVNFTFSNELNWIRFYSRTIIIVGRFGLTMNRWSCILLNSTKKPSDSWIKIVFKIILFFKILFI
jgi:hypothetical protein